jgi:ATP-binding cassette, subfamily B, bacterial MsbA
MKANLGDFGRLAGSIRRLNRYFGVPRRIFGVVLVSSICAAILEGLGVGLLMPLLELLRSEAPAQPMKPIRILMDWFPGHGASFYVIGLCGIVVASIVLKNLFLFISTNAAASMRATALLNLREVVFRRMLNADLAVYEKHTSGEMTSVAVTDTGSTAYALEYLVFFLQRVAMGVCYLLALFFISWQLSILTALLAVVCGYTLGYLYRTLGQSGRELSEVNLRVGKHLGEALAGLRLIRATHSQDREIARFHEINRKATEIQRRSVRAMAILGPVSETTGVIGAMLIVGCAAVWLVQPGKMKGELLMGFAFVLVRLLPLLSQTYHLFGQTVNLAGHLEKVEEWLSFPLYPQKPFGREKLPGIERGIRLRNVKYSYPNGTQALRGIDLEIPAGQTVALVGGSGSGKSTLAMLLLRLRLPDEGSVLVDGRDYRDFDADSWHGSVAVVEQEAFLFNDTLANNIRYGCASASHEDVARAVAKAHLEHVVQELPDGLETIVGERGATLSGGQRQRMSIARALVRNPKLLILDEATSALDSVSELQVQEAIEEAQQGRTVVIIAHRFSTIRNADRIVVMDNGEIVEQGSWKDLERSGGAFSQLLAASQQVLV